MQKARPCAVMVLGGLLQIERVIRMAMHNDPMQRKQKYDAIMPDALGKI